VNSKGRLVAVLGLMVFVLILCNACSMTRQNPLTATIYPNLAQARQEGFSLLAGHPPFKVDFRTEVEGGDGALSYKWDLDGDGGPDSHTPDPEFVYSRPGEYTASVSVSDERGQKALAEQRIVVIGEPEWPDWRFGVQWSESYAETRREAHSEAQREAHMIAEAGIEAVRLVLRWHLIQPDGSDKYEWENYDFLVALSRRYKVDLLPVIGYSSEWASRAKDAASFEERISAPPLQADYAWFAYNAADRYKTEVRAWEVWNEPNLSQFWPPDPEPAAYANLLKQTYLAIKYADPQAVVVLGGLSNREDSPTMRYSPEEFLQVVYDQVGGSYFDVVGRHPYTFPSEGTEHLIRRLDALRIVMIDNGDAEKPIWLTEYGAPTTPKSGITEEMQGKWLTQSFDALSSSNHATTIFWFVFKDEGDDPNDKWRNAGLVKRDYELKPAYRAYKDYIEKNR
jgi:PKD repeat protein